MESGFRRWCRRLTILVGCAIASPAHSMDMISGLFGGGGEEEAHAEAKPAGDHGGGHGGGDGAASGSVDDSVYIQIDSLTAPVIVRQRVRAHILLTLSLEVPSISDKSTVARAMPRLRDAMLRDLYATPIVREDDSGHLDMETLRERMIQVARATIGTDLVKDILIVRAMRSS
jgi:hypothetical protein